MPKERIFVLLSFILLAFAAYRNCFGIFIPADNYSLFYIFETEGLKGAIHDLGAYLFSLPVVFLFYKLFADSSQLWITVSLILHCLNAYLVYHLTSKSIHRVAGKYLNLPALFSGIIFLLSPYQTEAVLWVPTDVPILIATLLFLICLLLIVNYLESGRNQFQFLSHAIFLLAVFSYESSFVLPAISLLWYIVYKVAGKTQLSSRRFILRIILPQAGIIFLYFMITKVIQGEWIWHGEEFGWSLSFLRLGGNILKYLTKFFFFFRYLPLGSIDNLLREVFSNPGYRILFFLLAISLLWGCVFVFIKYKQKEGLYFSVLFLCFIISLFPVLPLDSSYLKYIYPDRYGYLPSVFFYMFLVSAVYLLFKKIALPIVIVYSVFCWMLLTPTIAVWISVNKYCREITLSYKPFLQYDRVYILNVPTYCKGIAAFRSAFSETVFMQLHSPVEKMRVISGCYMESPDDSLTSVILKENRVVVTGIKKKTPYFSTGGGWARSYETDEYYVQYDPAGCAYTLLFKHAIPPKSIFIYISNGIWKKAI